MLVNRFVGLIEYSVNAVLDVNAIVSGFDMDITGPAVQRVKNGGVDQLDYRTGIIGYGLDRQYLFTPVGLLDQLQHEVFRDFPQHAASPFTGLDYSGYRRFRGDPDLNLTIQHQLQFVELDHIGGVADGNHNGMRSQLQRNEAVAIDRIRRQRIEQFFIHLEVAQINVLQVELL